MVMVLNVAAGTVGILVKVPMRRLSVLRRLKSTGIAAARGRFVALPTVWLSEMLSIVAVQARMVKPLVPLPGRTWDCEIMVKVTEALLLPGGGPPPRLGKPLHEVSARTLNTTGTRQSRLRFIMSSPSQCDVRFEN